MLDRIENPDSEMAESLGLLRRLGLFLMPLLFVFAFGEYLMWQSGENWPIQHVAQFQQDSQSPVLFSRNLMSQQFGAYKLERLQLVDPDVLVVGSSRVMQFRAKMFVPMENSFYNAGGMIQSSRDLLEFSQLVQQERAPAPQTLLIGVDPWWLKSENETRQEHRISSWDEVFRFCAHVESLKSIANGLHTDKLQEALSNREHNGGQVRAIGIAALTQGSGFRVDGSWRYPKQVRKSFVQKPGFVDREQPSVLKRIQEQRLQFAPPLNFDDQQREMLVQGIELLLDQGIEVWAFAPPFSSQSLHAISKADDFQLLWSEYKQLFSDLEQRGVRVLSQQTLSKLPDQYMIDGFHPGEVYSAEILVSIVKSAPQGSIFRDIDLQHLHQMIENAAAPLMLDASTTLSGENYDRISFFDTTIQ